jgi:hypothetical protein
MLGYKLIQNEIKQKRCKMNQDPEIDALSSVYDTLTGLNQAQIKRIIDWVTSKFGLSEEKPPVKVSEHQVAPPPVEPTEPGPKMAQPTPQPEQTAITGFMKFDTVEDLFFSSNVRTVASKILLVAAYLYEKHNLNEFSSFDINSRLKKVGYGVQNITNSINTLMDKEPPLLLQTGKMGDTKQAKRKFQVTEEGLRIARNYLTE